MTILGLALTIPAVSQVSVNINFGRPPIWGPYGYDDARYYYIPDIDVYYDIWDEQYIYCDRGRWIYVVSLPPRYRYYDFYSGYKVVLDYRGWAPYQYCNDHRSRYSGYRGYSGPRQYTYHDRGGRPQLRQEQYQQRARYYGDRNGNGNYRSQQRNDSPTRVERPSGNPQQGGGSSGNRQGPGRDNQGGGDREYGNRQDRSAADVNHDRGNNGGGRAADRSNTPQQNPGGGNRPSGNTGDNRSSRPAPEAGQNRGGNGGGQQRVHSNDAPRQNNGGGNSRQGGTQSHGNAQSGRRPR
jgi:hypothetical protein